MCSCHGIRYLKEFDCNGDKALLECISVCILNVYTYHVFCAYCTFLLNENVATEEYLDCTNRFDVLCCGNLHHILNSLLVDGGWAYF